MEKRLIVFSILISVSLALFSNSQSRSGDANPLDFYQLEIDLTREELQWVNNHRSIRVAGPKSFPPFYYYDGNNQPLGIASDYLKIIFDNLGITIEVQDNLLWPEVLEKTEQKDIDLIACSAKSSEREEYLLFTEPQLTFPLVIISRDDAPFIGGSDDLIGLKVALVEKNIITDWLVSDGIDVDAYTVKSPLEALESVSVGLSDAYIGNLATCSYLIGEQGLTNLKIAAPSGYGNYNLYMAVRDDWPELVSIINKGLIAISPEQRSGIRNRWLSIKYEYGLRFQDIILPIFIVILIAGVLFIIILRWNRRLQKEILVRKKVESELKEAFSDINTLEGLLPICAQCKKVRDDKGYWKQIEGYLEEHSDLLFSHSLCPACLKEAYGDKSWFKKKEDEK